MFNILSIKVKIPCCQFAEEKMIKWGPIPVMTGLTYQFWHVLNPRKGIDEFCYAQICLLLQQHTTVGSSLLKELDDFCFIGCGRGGVLHPVNLKDISYCIISTIKITCMYMHERHSCYCLGRINFVFHLIALNLVPSWSCILSYSAFHTLHRHTY